MEEAKIRISLEGIEEAKAEAGSLRAAQQSELDADIDPYAWEDDVEPQLDRAAESALRDERARRKRVRALKRKHARLAKQEAYHRSQQLQQGVGQIRSGGPMGVGMGTMNLLDVANSPGGVRGAVGSMVGRAGKAFAAGGMLTKGTMALGAAWAVGEGSSYLSDRGMTGPQMGGYNPIEFAAMMKREFDIMWAEKAGAVGGAYEVSKAAGILGSDLTDKQVRRSSRRSAEEAAFKEMEDKVFGRVERRVLSDAEIQAWMETAQSVLGVTDADLRELGAMFKQMLAGDWLALMGGK